MMARPVVACLMLAACGETTNSSLVNASAFWVGYAIETRDGGAPKAIATLRLDTQEGVALQLGDGDIVTCDGSSLVPSADADGAPVYAGAAHDGVTSHDFVLSRVDEPPHLATIATPRDFTLTSAPLAGTYNDQYTISWTEPGDAALITITARSPDVDCGVVTIVSRSTAMGSFAFDGSPFQFYNTRACDYEIDVAREQVAGPDPAFAGGEQVSRAIQATSLSIHP
jgi:hypothetical protein